MLWMLHWVVASAPSSPMTAVPVPTAAPGFGQGLIDFLTGQLTAWAFALTIAGLLVGAVIWALGSHSQNYQQSYAGRRAVLVSGLAALVLGAAPAIVKVFYQTGHTYFQ